MATVIADTNILVRVFIDDDPAQGRAALRVLNGSDHVAVPIVALCEFVWVASRSYKIPLADIAATIRRFTEVDNVLVDRPAVAAGLALLDAGGDFADGVIAYEGQRLGGSIFVSFDKAAVSRLNVLGVAATRPS